MAPVGMVGMLGWFSSAEVGIISLIIFLIVSITILALCAKRKRSNENTYNVNSTMKNGRAGAKGTGDARAGENTDPSYSAWRNHKNMPPSTLERSKVQSTR